MKVIHEREKCIGCGSCIAVCAKFFEMGEDGKAVLKGANKKDDGTFELEIGDEGCLPEAVDICPVQIIKLTK